MSGGTFQEEDMFVGHYGPAFAAKPASNSIPLWLLFVAVQFMDIVWALLVLLGVEKLRIVPGFTAMNPLDLYYMPYTHGLSGALALAALLGGASEYFIPQKGRTFLIVAACVFSHWLLDLVVHVPDMPLLGDRMKVGFGLWRWHGAGLVAEFASLFAGLFVLLRYAPVEDGGANLRLWALSAWLVVAEIFNAFGVHPGTPRTTAAMALGGYTIFALFAWQVDLARGRARSAKVPIPQPSI
jgi:hypothetical protein